MILPFYYIIQYGSSAYTTQYDISGGCIISPAYGIRIMRNHNVLNIQGEDILLHLMKLDTLCNLQSLATGKRMSAVMAGSRHPPHRRHLQSGQNYHFDPWLQAAVDSWILFALKDSEILNDASLYGQRGCHHFFIAGEERERGKSFICSRRFDPDPLFSMWANPLMMAERKNHSGDDVTDTKVWPSIIPHNKLWEEVKETMMRCGRDVCL